MLRMREGKAGSLPMSLLRRWYVLHSSRSAIETEKENKRNRLTGPAAIKSNIFGNHWWSVRMPTRKQEKQLKRQDTAAAKLSRMASADPREEKPILKHTTWVKR